MSLFNFRTSFAPCSYEDSEKSNHAAECHNCHRKPGGNARKNETIMLLVPRLSLMYHVRIFGKAQAQAAGTGNKEFGNQARQITVLRSIQSNSFRFKDGGHWKEAGPR